MDEIVHYLVNHLKYEEQQHENSKSTFNELSFDTGIGCNVNVK